MSRGQDIKIRFPKNFLWGASVSAHQVEGGQHNDWTVWELENARSLATQAPYQYGDLENWPQIKREATNPNNYVSGRALDHFGRYEEDFEILKSLGLNSFRFGIEWARIEPNEGEWDLEAIDHYRRYLKKLKELKITPVVTLVHFTLPVWFSEMGGFEKRKNVKYFVRYAQKILDELGGLFEWVITINEPEVYASESYLQGVWPPQKSSRYLEGVVLRNLSLAHRKVVRAARKKKRNWKFSVAKNSSYIYAGDDSSISKAYAKYFQWKRDDRFLGSVVKYCDFIGLNYYFSDRVYGSRVHNPNLQKNDMGWDMQPKNIQLVIERLSYKYHLPIMVTENGLADSNDKNRKWWIAETIKAMAAARKNGAKIIGHLYWSLLDNFEWDKGFWPKFGLVSVNRATMKRTVRPSAKWYGAVVKKLSK